MNGKDDKPTTTEPERKLPLLSVDRRGFLKALGISGAATAAACERLPTRKALPFLLAPEEITPGVPVRYASTCTGCTAACGLMVTVRDGRPIKLEGKADHPLSRGGLCALGQAEIRGLYDAGRVTKPRIGGRDASWNDVDAQVRTALSTARGNGGGVRVLTSTLTSPTARRTVLEFLAPYGGALVEHDPGPTGAAATLAAYEAIDGRRSLPSLDFSSADLFVSLGADLLGTGADPVVHTAGYAARRAEAADRGVMRHVQIEGALSLTGAGADQRILATASERTAIALWLLRSVAQRAGADDVLAALSAAAVPSEAPLGDRIARLADNLYGARGRCLVVSGSDDVAEQAAVALLNRVLGNEGRTLDLARPSLVRRGVGRELDALRAELAGGKVAALFVIGIDPVDQLADGDQWRDWIAGLPLSVAITDRPTATAAACKIHAAAHHGLECWHDFQPRPDVLTLAQPTIRPLYDTRQPFESFLVWSDAPVKSYHDHLKESWRQHVFTKVWYAGGYDGFWFESVAAGAPPYRIRELPELATRPKESLASLLKPAPAGDAGAVQVELVAQVGVRDGTRSFNPWLRELPDPLTRVSWWPVAVMAPSRAAQLGVGDGDMVRIQAGDQSVEMAARVLPGQHPNVIAVPVGYGRVDGDHADVPRNGYRLAAGAATVARAGGHDGLPLAQVHNVAEGRPIIHQVPRPDARPPAGHEIENVALWDERPESAPHWHMSINLDACTGCSACVVACQAENNTPVVGPDEVRNNRNLYWIRIDRYFMDSGEADNPDVVFEPMLCAQCDNAPCETVCPVAATVHSADGLNMQAYNRCVGTRYCANNCPYKVRRFNWFQYEHGQPVERLVLNPDVVVRERGVMEKCTFCAQRIQLARIEARNRGDDSVPEVRTACQQSCPANAIQFGDVTNPESRVSTDRANPRAFQVLADIGIKPSITYLARVRSRES